jgi:hypothetical protein
MKTLLTVRQLELRLAGSATVRVRFWAPATPGVHRGLPQDSVRTPESI